MRITEILTESQLEQLDEGPILNKIGTTVGNVAGGVAKGVGAVAGGIAGLGSAFKKGFDRSKGIVGQGGDYVAPPDAPAPPKAGTPAPAAAPGAPAAAAPAPSTTTPPSAADINAQGPKGTAPAKAQTGDAGKALAKSTAVVDKQQAASQTKANQTVYAQIKANVDKLDKKGKQQILQLLQKSMSMPAPAAPAAAPAAATKRAASASAPPGAGAAAFGNMAGQLAKGGAAEPTAAAAPAAAPAAPAAAAPAAAGGQTLTPQQQAAQAATKARLQGTKAAGKSVAASTTGGFKAGVAGARAKGIATASKVNHGNALSEALAQRVELRKQKMFETGLAQGTISIFKK